MPDTIVHIGTYLPFKEGISTFTANLLSAQRKIHPHLKYLVAAIDLMDYKSSDYPKEVKWIIRKSVKEDYIAVAEKLNSNKNISCIYLQHEYGIYGGELGEYLLDFLKANKKPIFITLHTVLPEPSEKMFEVTQKIIGYANKVIVMTKLGKKTLQKVYGTPGNKITVIKHGMHPTIFITPAEYKAEMKIRDRFILGTFGFLGTGKGIEYVIRALPKVIEKFPNTEYWLMGKTHPLVLKEYGEQYRESLIKEVKDLGLTSHVKFYNKYLSFPQVLKFLKMVDIYIATSLDPDQAVSGTLSYALGTGRCIVSTAFIQAKEYKKQDFGELVGFRDSEAYSKAIIKLLGDNKRRERIQKGVYQKNRGMLWPNVGNLYMELNHKVERFPQIKIRHLVKMTDDFGFIQFAKKSEPDLEFGYTLDDNARALVFSVLYYERFRKKETLKLIEKYLNFIHFCQSENGEFFNYVSRDRIRLETNPWQSEEDANGRALWALGALRGTISIPLDFKNRAASIWDKWQKAGKVFNHPRAIAFYIKGLAYGNEAEKIAVEAEKLVKYYDENSKGNWKWFLQELTYANGVLPEALFIAYKITGNGKYLAVASATLKFLINHTFRDGLYIPIGQTGWFPRNSERSYFDEQPEDPYSMISLLLAAFKVTGNKKLRRMAKRAMLWFYGNNLLGQSLYDAKSGGCHDGLAAKGLNPNEGAESTISYLLSLQGILQYE